MAALEKTPDLTDEEMVEHLKLIVREDGNAAARIAAIRQLRLMRAGEQQASSGEGFEALDELAPRRKKAS